jgi:hypothetical protein
MRHMLIIALAITAAPAAADPPAVADPVMESLSSICGKTFEGRVTTTDAADRDFATSRLVMHVQSCTANEVRMPFQVGEDRSRTWILTRTNSGYRLKHRHLHEDGSPDTRTNYGGDHLGAPRPMEGGGWRLEFLADAESKALFVREKIPQSAANVWAIEHVPGQTHVYELKRPERHLRVAFDLSREVATPPAPWGD